MWGEKLSQIFVNFIDAFKNLFSFDAASGSGSAFDVAREHFAEWLQRVVVEPLGKLLS